jgi:hypothetical protein
MHLAGLFPGAACCDIHWPEELWTKCARSPAKCQSGSPPSVGLHSTCQEPRPTNLGRQPTNRLSLLTQQAEPLPLPVLHLREDVQMPVGKARVGGERWGCCLGHEEIAGIGCDIAD